MEEPKVEVWIDVPETGTRVEVSNRGHLRVVGKKVGRGRHVVLSHVNEARDLVCDYKTERFGWYVFFDGRSHYLDREELLSLFPSSFLDVDRSHDEAARRKRNETFVDLDAKRKEASDAGRANS